MNYNELNEFILNIDDFDDLVPGKPFDGDIIQIEE